MTHKLEDQGRRPINYLNRSVQDVLPEYFTSEYPNLVTFLEKYYDFLDSDGQSSFGTEINQLFTLRDVTETPEEYLDRLIAELGAGLQNGDNFTDARFSARRFADYYRNKGTRFSIEEFFRAFFQQEVTVEYPKEQLLYVGGADNDLSKGVIGYDGQRFVQNYERYQIFSILLKVGLGVPTYRELYKKFVHPAGFYFEGEVAIEGVADLGFDTMPLATADSAAGVILSEFSFAPSASTNITGLIDSADGTAIRYNIDALASAYSEITADEINSYYSSISEFITPNSFTMDDSGTLNSPRMSMTLETMDNNMFTSYTSDSSY